MRTFTRIAAICGALASPAIAENRNDMESRPHPFVGLWVTADGHIRHELLASGRYVEARGNRERAYQGRYTVTGNHIDYWDDTGFTADGDFNGDVLHHAGMVLHRRE
jgi:hypothetical protein